jgi:hypothetical protein
MKYLPWLSPTVVFLILASQVSRLISTSHRHLTYKKILNWVSWCVPEIPALRRLSRRVRSSRLAWAAQGDPVSKKEKRKSRN